MNQNKLKLTQFVCMGLLSLGGVEQASAESKVSAVTQQVTTIRGTVTDGTEPIIGATIKGAGSSEGTVTDLNGNFSLDVKPGTPLVISYVGYKTVTVKAADHMTVTLHEDAKNLKEVVVTALGIKRDRKALGYGLTEVKGADLQKAKETNVINSLEGKVAGLIV